MPDPTTPKSKKPVGNYTVGYKKPPAEHQFKPSHLLEGAPKVKRARRKTRRMLQA